MAATPDALCFDMQHAVSVDTEGKALYLTFISLVVGWALADNRTTFLPEPGGGIRKGDVIALLQTTDGGRTWQEIAHSTV